MASKGNWIATVVIAAAILVGACIGSYALRHRNDGPKTISVKGSAEQNFVSDLVVWDLTLVSHSSTPLQGLRDVDRQRDILRNFLKEKGVSDEELVFGAVDYYHDTKGYYDKSQERYVEIDNGYNVSQVATVTSNSVDNVELIARSVGELIELNVTVNAQAPKYYYTKLASLKLEMVAAAAQDARDRADAIAKESNGKLGGVRRSSLGIFQIVGRYSNEDYSWGGNFNVSSKEKTVSVTVTSEFLVR